MCWAVTDVPRKFRGLPQVLYTVESEANYPCINGQAADLEMSYRTCAQVWSPYVASLASEQIQDIHSRQPLHFDEKLDAIMYSNSNCAAQNNRQAVVAQLQKLLRSSRSGLELHSYGRCNPNMDDTTLADFRAAGTQPERTRKKLKYASRYKFCVAMENSIAQDYVTKKLLDALAAGCVPIYWGAPNVADFLPHDDAIVDFSRLGSAAALLRELERLASNRTAYEQKLAWKKLPLEHTKPGFQRLLAYTHLQPMCDLCRLAVDWNKSTTQPRYTLCSDNKTWRS